MNSVYRLAPMIFVMGAIFFASHQPGDSVHLPAFNGADKVAHFFGYAILAGSVFFAHSHWQTRPIRPLCLRVLLVVTLFGISDEFHQSFVPMRYPSIGDVIADVSGGLFIIGCYCIWRKIR